jgi:hypothetical protein
MRIDTCTVLGTWNGLPLPRSPTASGQEQAPGASELLRKDGTEVPCRIRTKRIQPKTLALPKNEMKWVGYVYGVSLKGVVSTASTYQCLESLSLTPCTPRRLI